ncbi:MAG: hypothetical protein MI974_22905, partial [Chitinophagales bacterium]|nr:hypothetical protein [Chitinophagales bacterium]
MSWFNTGFLLPILIIVGVNLEYNGDTTLQDHSQQLNVSEVDNALLPSCRIWSEVDWNAMSGASVVYDSCNVGTATISDDANFNPLANDQYHLVYTDICGDGEIVAKINAAPTNNGYSGIEIREHDGAGARKLLLLTRYSSVMLAMKRDQEGQVPVSATLVKPVLPVWVKITRSGNWLYAYASNDGVSWTYLDGVFLTGLSNCLNAGISAQNDGVTTTTVDYSEVGIVDDGLPTTEVNFTESTINANAGDNIQICLEIANGCGSCVPTSLEVALTSSNTPHLTTYTTEPVAFSDGNITQCFDLTIGNESGDGTYTFGMQNITGGNNAQEGSSSVLTLNVTGSTSSSTKVNFSEANMNGEPGTTVNVCVDLVNPCSSCDVPTVDVMLQGTGLPHLSQYTTETLTFSNGSLMECFPLVIENDASVEDYTFTLVNATGGDNIEIGQPSDMNLHVASFTSLSFSNSSMNGEPGTTVNVCVDLVNPCSSCDVPTVDVMLQGTGLPHLSQYTTETLTFSNGSLMECFPLVIENDAAIEDYTFTLANAAGGNNIEINQPSDMDLHVASFTSLSFSNSSMNKEPGTTGNVC